VTEQQWPQVKALFQAALEQPPAARVAFLAAATADPALRDEVVSLLRSDTSGVSYLDQLPDHREHAHADPLGAPLGSIDEWASDPVLKPGLRIGPYEIVAPIGAGAMGEVYRARDTNLHRDVALKVLPERFARDADRLARLTREAHVLASLNHPNIAAIYGLEEAAAADGRHIRALVLELVQGRTLADRIAEGPLPPAEALPIARQIVDALAAAHEKGIIHRDLKPANIKFAANGAVKVLDFGLAKVRDDGPRSGLTGVPTLTSTSLGGRMIVGTPGYMSPEQARGTSLDTRTDIWSFGCVLYEMLSGAPPFAGATISDTIAAILEHEPDWQTLPAAASPEVRRLLYRCLDRDATRRLQDFRDARLALDRALNPAAVSRRRLYVPAGLLIVALFLVAVRAGLFYSARPSPPVTSPSEYIPITTFADSAVAPALSPDGRMVTFIRGGEFFLSKGGQIYVKRLPDGEPVQLTNDAARKYAPVFTPDGTRIAYSNVTATSATSYLWETWTVPVGGGQPTRFLPNATGLTWIGDRRVLFSEIMTGTSIHMGLVTATERRTESREIYFPPHESGMVHYSQASPDLKSVLVVEMNQTHTFNQPCRLLPFDGSSAGRQVGPEGTCTSAAWSPDGRWMYFGARVGGSSHLWRQKFADGAPEQITFGPFEEEGVAPAPDGRSLITSAGSRRSAIWLHDGAGDRPVSLDGYAVDPTFSRDGTRVFYLLARELVMSGAGWTPSSAQLRVVDVRSGKTDTVLPDVSVADYDFSRDEKEVILTTRDSHGPSRIWLASVDRRTAPREIARDGDQVSFGTNGDIVFRSLDGTKNSLVRIKKDGSGRERITATPILDKFGVSPDGAWVIAFALGRGGDAVPGTFAVPVHGGVPRRICGQACRVVWSSDGKMFYVSDYMHLAATSMPRTLAIPVPAGKSLPDFGASGIDFNLDPLQLPGVRVLAHGPVSPGSDTSTYLFTRADVQLNLFRIPLH
jgi:serine/threonine protein kinase/Tol biopolymer transport system component